MAKQSNSSNDEPEETDSASPESSLPSVEEISKLPRWAIVAFAARCARRLLPLYSSGREELAEGLASVVDEIVVFAEDSARFAGNYHGLSQNRATPITDVAIKNAIVSAESAAKAAPNHIAYFAARSTTDAASIAWLAIDNSVARERLASKASDLIQRIARRFPSLISAISADFESLLETSSELGWDDNTPVDIVNLGPLWPHGAPLDWPQDARREAGLYDRDIKNQYKGLIRKSVEERIEERSERQRSAAVEELSRGVNKVASGLGALKKDFDAQDHSERIDELFEQVTESAGQVESLRSLINSLEDSVEALRGEEARQELAKSLETSADQHKQVKRLLREAKKTSEEVSEYRKAQRDIARPLDFWKRRSRSHFLQFLAFGLLTVLVGIAGVGAVLSLMVIDDDGKAAIAKVLQEKVLDKAGIKVDATVPAAAPGGNAGRPNPDVQASGTTGEAGAQQANGEPSAARNEQQTDEKGGVASGGGGGPPIWFPWHLGLTALLSTMLLLLLRILTKITLSNLHLSTEAHERVVMARTYFDFISGRKSEGETGDDPSSRKSAEELSRELNFRKQLDKSIIEAMFRPTTTGLVKGDSAPPTLFEKIAGSDDTAASGD